MLGRTHEGTAKAVVTVERKKQAKVAPVKSTRGRKSEEINGDLPAVLDVNQASALLTKLTVGGNPWIILLEYVTSSVNVASWEHLKNLTGIKQGQGAGIVFGVLNRKVREILGLPSAKLLVRKKSGVDQEIVYFMDSTTRTSLESAFSAYGGVSNG